MKENNLIWALVDNRTGNKNQLLGILGELKIPYKIKKVQYNFIANLPNFIIQFLGGRIHINNFSKDYSGPFPNIILSCGRRTFPLANKLKKNIKPSPFSVHLMYPKYSININSTDIIFTPEHDKIKNKVNLIKTFGTPGQISHTLKKPYKTNLSKPIVSMLIGGDHGKYRLKIDAVKNIISTVTHKMKQQGTILISTSRRTSSKIINYLESISEKNKLIKNIYHPKANLKKNPLVKMLSIADEIIVTGDSMSMTSEVCELKKPIRIFFNKDICAPKHMRFCNNLIKDGYAFPFETFLKKCHKIKVLKTTKFISKEIIKKLKNEHYKH